MSEINIQNAIRIALSESGIVIRMNTGLFKTATGAIIKQGIKGLPDLLWIGPNGRTVWLEVKTPTGRASDEQKRFISKLQSMGHTAGIARSVEDALRLIGNGE